LGLEKIPIAVRQLNDGQSVRNAAKIAGKGISTVQRVKGKRDSKSDQRFLNTQTSRFAMVTSSFAKEDAR